MNCITLNKSILVFPIDYNALLMLSQATIKKPFVVLEYKRDSKIEKQFPL